MKPELVLAHPLRSLPIAWLFSAALLWSALPRLTGQTYPGRSANSSGKKIWVECTASSILRLKVNYSKTTQLIYRDVTIAEIDLCGNLDCFTYILHSPEVEDWFPSWIPRWDIGHTAIKRLSRFTREPYNAGLVSKIVRLQEYAPLRQLELVSLK
jgi:hypothetical protein